MIRQLLARLTRRSAGAPIVPKHSVAGRTLLMLITIMSFLSAVTLGGVVLVQKSAIAWSADVGREMTIQIRPVEGEVMESNLRTAVSLAQATPGVAGARALSLEESQALLEPWLGAGLDLSAIAVPRLIVVQLGDPVDADIDQLQRNLQAIKGASLDTHAAWRQQLNTMAGTVVISGLLVLGLIGVATVLAIIFATRGAMATNREIVDVLHFIGASNKFIAGEFQGRFLTIGLQGGLLGALLGTLFFILIGTAAGSVLPTEATTQVGFIFGNFVLGIDGTIFVILVIPVIAVLTAVTSRMTVRRYLSEAS
ncbi:FtsX-like permease family protein [Devosia sp. BK]|uniref:cell division protein FtsX n=1 Tax=unclassified Devosia TaxID=196773 RepID=UPI0007129120|nr:MULTISPECIES: FtsX-like permease family protein [unclassified Devosia]KQT48022.1 cell division protein FtsX [Devosia sp. Leaf420]MDV3252115.1 FtsX-like permease family protein [Devosia sp. BK]